MPGVCLAFAAIQQRLVCPAKCLPDEYADECVVCRRRSELRLEAWVYENYPPVV